ncbi:unnamed protein product [Protopolystoma xenopodis]|uniref:Exportin-1/Importin-beta-like domain-containing protein n=1 Tax=Protopolystoma xenopodis TaxID=117903 RepID=A0A448WBD2_9PLAT|nr:unnamed protein product [Protopolystoma xenopodis]
MDGTFFADLDENEIIQLRDSLVNKLIEYALSWESDFQNYNHVVILKICECLSLVIFEITPNIWEYPVNEFISILIRSSYNGIDIGSDSHPDVEYLFRNDHLLKIAMYFLTTFAEKFGTQELSYHRKNELKQSLIRGSDIVCRVVQSLLMHTSEELRASGLKLFSLWVTTFDTNCQKVVLSMNSTVGNLMMRIYEVMQLSDKIYHTGADCLALIFSRTKAADTDR